MDECELSMREVLPTIFLTNWQQAIFSNASDDIRALFGRACDRLGVDRRPHNVRNLSVARRPSVRLLEQFVGAKH